MSKPGRNEPCPCKSGKKYKNCHLIEEGNVLAASNRAMRLHEMERSLADRLLNFSVSLYGEEWLRDILDRVGSDGGGGILGFVVPCSVYESVLEQDSILDQFLASAEASAGRLTDSERAWLNAQKRSWISVWEVLEVTPGVGLSVRDFFTGEARWVIERSGSRSLSPRDCVLSRVVDFEGMSVFCGMHPRSLPPRPAAFFVESIRKLLKLGAKIIPASLLRAKVPFEGWLLSWGKLVEQIDREREVVPTLQNTDGDPLLITRDHFEFDPIHRPTIEAELAKLSDEAGDDETASSAERSFTFHRPGNAMHKQWDNTVVGRADLRASKFVLETNSIRRADDLQAKVEGTLKAIVRHRLRDHQDPAAALRTGRDSLAKSRAPESDDSATPEMIEALRQFKTQHYQGWLDTPLPALSGLTPRAAAAKPSKRKQVMLIMKEIENRESRLPPHERFDVSTLWQALNLKEDRVPAPAPSAIQS
ncbi:MAG: hypothetical protein NVSMB1_01580 [Polyangiales bacterium]